MLDCLAVYLAGHNRPVHEVLFSNDKDIASEYDRSFVGMTEEPCPLPELLAARGKMREELARRISPVHRQFLLSVARGEPEWQLLPFEHLSKLPALRWKQENLARFKASKPSEFDRQVEALRAHFD